MVRMYHPGLGREIEVPDDDGCIAAHAEAGWKVAPEPEARPGYGPEPVTYEPVTRPKTKPTSKSKESTPTAGAEGDEQ